MYVGLAALTLALFMDSWWPILLLLPVLFAVRVFKIAREEDISSGASVRTPSATRSAFGAGSNDGDLSASPASQVAPTNAT
jgi:hypothetical protein